MLNKVISTLQRTARDAGHSTLRFSYRGLVPVPVCTTWPRARWMRRQRRRPALREQHPDLPLTLLGFSFGGFVAASLAGRLEQQGVAVERLFMVAPAVARLPADTPLAQRAELTLIQPEQDEVIDPALVYAWSQALPRAHELKVAECGHFFTASWSS